MRIAMIGQKGIPASFDQAGGIERHVETLSEALAKHGHEVFVYVRSYANPRRRTTWNGVRLFTLPAWRRKHLEAAIHTFLASIHVLFQRVDIIHYHGVGPSTFAWIPRLLKPRARVVVTFHSRDQMNEKWGWIARAYLAFGEWTACVFPHLTIAVSHGIQLLCQQLYRARVAYIPNGVDIPLLKAGTRTLEMLGLQQDGYFLMVSRLVPLKAQDDAIKAFARVQTTKKLVIVGDPTYDEQEYYETLKRMAIRDERILLVGARWGEELHELRAHCYAMIHASRVEGLPFAILEGMAQGKMVIMSDIPPNRELVDHSGIAYPVGSVTRLAEVITWSLQDPEIVRVRGLRGREVVRRLYSWEHFIQRTEEEYSRLLGTYDILDRTHSRTSATTRPR